MTVARAPSPILRLLRVVTRRGSLPARTKTSSSGLASLRSLPMRISAPSVTKAVLSAITASWPGRSADRCIAGGPAERERPSGPTSRPFSAPAVESSGRCAPLTNTTRWASSAARPSSAASISAGRHRRRIADRRRQRLLQRRAQVGVLPLLDAPMRQAERRRRRRWPPCARRPRRGRPAASRRQPRRFRR